MLEVDYESIQWWKLHEQQSEMYHIKLVAIVLCKFKWKIAEG